MNSLNFLSVNFGNFPKINKNSMFSHYAYIFSMIYDEIYTKRIKNRLRKTSLSHFGNT